MVGCSGAVWTDRGPVRGTAKKAGLDKEEDRRQGLRCMQAYYSVPACSSGSSSSRLEGTSRSVDRRRQEGHRRQGVCRGADGQLGS